MGDLAPVVLTSDGHERPVGKGCAPPARRARHTTPPASTRPVVITSSIIEDQVSTKVLQQKNRPLCKKIDTFRKVCPVGNSESGQLTTLNMMEWFYSVAGNNTYVTREGI